MRNPGIVLSLAVVGVVLATAPVFAQTKPAAADVPQTAAEPSQSSLTVGALQIGSATNLVVVGFDINVTSDNIIYSYYLKNAGSTALDLAAAVSLPELQASADRSETWVLAASDPENPIGLTITAAGAPVTTKAEVHAYALGVDRLDVIKAEHLPLVPFGREVDKALEALAPDTADRLAALGIISPRDPAQPKAPGTADWSLDVVRSWRQVLPPGATTPIVIKFTPVKAQYRMTKSDLQDLDDEKDEVCLKPPVLSSLQSRLKSGGAWKVTDIELADDAPAHWIDSPNPTLSVQKPAPDAIVAFCGMDEKTASRPIVLGVAPDDNDGIRIVIFQPAGK
jgi:Domain of unknown function (DUF4424)